MKKIIFAVVLILCFTTVCFAYDFILTIPDQHIATVRDALCDEWNYEENCLKDNGECDETKKEFLERKLRKYIKDVVNNYLTWQEIQVAEADANQVAFD